MTKKDIIKAGLGRKKFPPMTSKHVVKEGNGISHISAIERRIDIPLEVLKDETNLMFANLESRSFACWER